MPILYKIVAYILVALCCVYIFYEIDNTHDYLDTTNDGILRIICFGIIKGLWIGLAIGLTKGWVDSLEMMYYAAK